MRISQYQIYGPFLDNLNKGRQRIVDAQEQLSAGKRILRPSDDPSSYNQILSDKTRLSVLDQRLRNIDLVGTPRLTTADSTLQTVSRTLTRVKELAVQFANGTYGAGARSTGAREVRQLLLELKQLANTQVQGQPLFGGTGTHGRATGLAVSEPVAITDGTDDELTVTVDGTTSGTIDLVSADDSLNGDDLAALVQSKINTDATLSAAGKSVTVTFENERLVIASNGTGAASTVRVTGGTAVATLGFGGGSQTTGEDPFGFQAVTQAAAANTGGAVIGQGKVTDPDAVTFDNYLVKFSSATTFSVYNTAMPVNVTAGSNTGGVETTDAGVVDPAQVTLDTYQIAFTSATQYSVTNTTTGATVSSGNTYTPGSAIEFDGLRVVLKNGAAGGPATGDTFTVAQTQRTVLANRTYTSGAAITFDGLEVSIRTDSSGPATGDRFQIVTGVQYQGDAGTRTIEIQDNETVKTNLAGSEVFSGSTVDIFAAIKDLTAALNGNYAGGIKDAVAAVDQAFAQVSNAQGEIGALGNRLETTAANLTAAKELVTTALSQNEDVDIAKAIADFTQEQQALQAVMQIGGRMFDLTLLRFLR